MAGARLWNFASASAETQVIRKIVDVIGKAWTGLSLHNWKVEKALGAASISREIVGIDIPFEIGMSILACVGVAVEFFNIDVVSSIGIVEFQDHIFVNTLSSAADALATSSC